jgi:hypothetical protein
LKWLDCKPQKVVEITMSISRARKSLANERWRVGKTMQPDEKGAIKLARKYGQSLICVRYRLSNDGSERITTVELEVDRVGVQKRANPDVSVKIYASETDLRMKARAKGARYNGTTRLWRMTTNDALALGLVTRIAKPASGD